MKRTAGRARSGSSSSNETRREAEARGSGIFNGLKICIINAKLKPETIGELSDLAENKGARLVAADNADIVITEIGAKQRLERHMTWEAAQRSVVLIPDWLTDSVAANQLLQFDEKYWAIPILPPRRPVPQFIAPPEPVYTPSGSRDSPIELSDEEGGIPVNPMSNYCCFRRSPLVCPNQDLVSQFATIKRAREFEGNEEASALAYGRCIATLKAYPKKIKTVDEIGSFPFIGPKMRTKISEYLTGGRINEAYNLWNNERFQVMSEFTKIYGIGPTTATWLYQSGMRSLKDLEDYFTQEIKSTDKNRNRNEGILTALALYDDFNVKISREEIEEIARLIMQELEHILPGCVHTITGGYRRGKAESNDIDIVFTHPQHGKGKGTLERLVSRLQRRGLLTHLLPTGSFRNPDHVKSYSQDQALERVLSVFALGKDAPSFKYNPAGEPRKHRRLDLIFAPVETYWCAVIGWTGSVMYERDLRRWCKEQGEEKFKFDSSGLTRRRDSTRIPVNSERHLFEIVGLPYIDPEYRNCDY